MQIFQTYNSNLFKLNGIKYVKNFMVIKQGTNNISVHNAYDTKYQLLSSTPYNQVSIDGNTYPNQAELMGALATLLFAKQIVDVDSVLTGVTQTLQQVTNEGNYTNHNIDLYGSANNTISLDVNTNSLTPRIFMINDTANSGSLQMTNVDDAQIWELPNASGTIALTSNIPSTPNLHQVTSVSGRTTNDIEVYAPLAGNPDSFVRLSGNGQIKLLNNDSLTMVVIDDNGLNVRNTLYYYPNKSGTTYTLATTSDIPSTDVRITGGTYSAGTAVFRNNTGSTFSVTGFSTGYTLSSTAVTSTLGYTPYNATNPNGYITGYTDTYVTGGTYVNGTCKLKTNSGVTISITGFAQTLQQVTNLGNETTTNIKIVSSADTAIYSQIAPNEIKTRGSETYSSLNNDGSIGLINGAHNRINIYPKTDDIGGYSANVEFQAKDGIIALTNDLPREAVYRIGSQNSDGFTSVVEVSNNTDTTFTFVKKSPDHEFDVPEFNYEKHYLTSVSLNYPYPAFMSYKPIYCVDGGNFITEDYQAFGDYIFQNGGWIIIREFDFA